MPHYDFKALSSHDFEDCVRDLLQKDLGVRLESFKSGRDQGIDLRYSKDSTRTLIVQCKHYADSGYSSLYKKLKDFEVPKVNKLAPERYVIATSVGLSPANKEKIMNLFLPFCKSPSDIYGKEDLNNLLGQFPEVEKDNFKLWLSSSTVLNRIVHSKVFNYSETELERIKRKIKIYVQNKSFSKAKQILDELHYCIIAGIPGIGKTTLAEILLVHYLRLGYEPIKIGNDISEAYSVLDQKKRQIFYYDDFLGQNSLEEKLGKNEDESLLRFMTTVTKAKYTKLILTTREYILAQAKNTYEKLSNFSFDAKKCIVDLEDYTKFHRAKILYNHLYFSGLSSEYHHALLFEKNYMKVIEHENFNPRIIEGMTEFVGLHGVAPENYFKSFVSYLDNPSMLWKHAFEKQLSISSKHVLLVLASLPDEVLYGDLEKAFDSFYKYRSREYSFPIDPEGFNLALKELESNFIKIDKYGHTLVVKFHNPSIRDFLVNFIRENEKYIHDLVISASFFNQIIRLWGSTTEFENPSNFRRALTGMGENLKESIKKLLHSKDCRLFQTGYLSTNTISRSTWPIPIEIRSIYALHIARQTGQDSLVEFTFDSLIDHLRRGVDKSGLKALLEDISKNGLVPPIEFMSLAEERLLTNLEDLEDFEIAIEFSEKHPMNFSENRLNDIRKSFEDSFTDFVDAAIVDSDHDHDPEPLNKFADRLDALGTKLDIDVGYEYRLLMEQAEELERMFDDGESVEYGPWKDESGGSTGTDVEIHSMFESLG